MRRKGIAVAWIILCFALFMVFRIKGAKPVGALFPAAVLVYTAAGCLAVCCGDGLRRPAVCRRFSDRGLFLAAWGILMLFWLPAYLALFPGTFGYDVPEQMQQFFGRMPLTSHHPVAHTWLVGIFLQAGDKLFHSWQAGFAVFSFLQGMVVTNSLTCSFLFLKRRNVPVLVLLLGILGCGLHPILQVLSFNATKDTLFGAFFLYFTMAFIAVLESAPCCGGMDGRATRENQEWKGREGTEDNPGGKIGNGKPGGKSGNGKPGGKIGNEKPGGKGGRYRLGACIRLLLSGILMCLFRNQGVYIVLVLLFCCLFFRAGRNRAVVGCLGTVVLLSEAFFLICSHGLGIPQGDKREMLCVPMQQAAIVWQNRENADISPGQAAAIEEVIEPGALLDYLPACADPVKVGFHTEALMEDPGKYLRVYLEVGLQNPGLYVNAFQALTLPYLDGSLYRIPETTLEFTFPDANEWGIERDSLFPAYEAYLEKVVRSPVCVFLLQPGMAVYLLVILAGMAIAGKRGKLFLSILPGGLFFGTLLLSSGALLRYIYPLMLSAPLLAGLLFEGKDAVLSKKNPAD